MTPYREREVTENTPINERFRLLAESSIAGIYLIQEGCFRYVNPALARAFGYEVEEIANELGPMDLVYPDDRPLVAENIRRRITGEIEDIRYDFRGLRKDGSVIHVEVHGRRIEYGGQTGVIGTLIDVTEQRQVEAALRASEERLQLALDAARAGQWEWNIVTGEVAWSPQCLALYGLPPNTQISYERFLQAIHPEDRERIDAALRRAVEDRASYDEPKRTIWPDGSIHWTASRAQVYCDDAGQPIRMVGVTFDITKWKEIEDELRCNREAAMQFSDWLAALQEITSQLSKAESSDGLCRLAVQLGRTRLGFDRVGIWFIDEPSGIMRGSFGTDEDGALRDEREAQVEFRHEGLAWHIFSRKESMAIVEHRPLYDHLGQQVGEGDNGMAALWDGDEVIGVISVDNFLTQQPITKDQCEVLRLYASTLGHLITRKRTEEALRASEARFRTLVDHAADAFFLHDESGAILDVNRQACESLGYSHEELVKMTPKDFDVMHDSAFLDQMRGRLDAGEVMTFDTRHRRKDGSIFPVEVRVRPLWQGKRRFGVSLARDITRRQQAETALRQRETQLQHIIDTVPEGVLLLDDNGRVQLTNPIAERFLTVLAPKWEDGRLTRLGPQPLSELLTSPPKGLWHEITNDDLVFEAIARPVENSAQNAGWVLVLRDVTQERNIQRQVQQQEQLAAVGQLAAGIAHDFNNILAVITLYTELIMRTVEMPARAQERLQIVEQQTKRAADLIQQILDFSRQSILERQTFDLAPFMEKLVTLLERTLPEHIQVKLDHADESYIIQADPTRMQQVMMNLAVNARDAMPEGGLLQIKLAHLYTRKPRPMPLHDLPPGNWVQIEVTDSGNGIPPEVFAHIFEPFFTTKEVGRGTGLGLAQVYGIVQQHEGYIDVTTEVGQGTSFFLYFPSLNTGCNEVGIPNREALSLGQGQKILLVEDNPTIREALADSLNLLNYEVLAAANGREALALLTTNADEVDLVLSDAVMPEMGGIALYHAMRNRDLPVPVVLLTGHPLSKEMENLQKLGLAGWLPKPPDLSKLSHLLAELLAAPQKSLKS